MTLSIRLSMTGHHVPHRYLISKSCTPTKYRHVTPTGYLPAIGLLTRRSPTIYIKQYAICGHITGEFIVLPATVSTSILPS
eukprot:6181908-Pleurochrysis_carterae.AAC.1